MFISGGENVYPAEVEAVFSEHPLIAEIAVVGRADAKWSEVGVAYLVLQDAGTAHDATLEELTAWGGERLARYKIPHEFIVVESLPRTASGKIQKHRL